MIFEKKEKTNLFVKTRILFILTSCFLFLASPIFSQKTKMLLADGDKAFAEKDFFSAAGYYNKAILQDSSDIVVQYKYADASRLNYDYDIAEHWYTKVFKKDAQGKLYPECSFWLATLKKSKGNYKDAKKCLINMPRKTKRRKIIIL